MNREPVCYDDDEENDVPEAWELTIRRVGNGFVLTGISGVTVFEEPENQKLDPDPDTVARMLSQVIDYFGASGSKHDPARVRVVVDKQKGKSR